MRFLFVCWNPNVRALNIAYAVSPPLVVYSMRAIGMAERTLDLMIARVTDPSRRTFGKVLARHGTIAADVAKIRIEINAARLMVLAAADKIDRVNAKGALRDIAMAKVLVPNVLQRSIDLAIQAFGAAGLSQDFPLARFHAGARALRIADGELKDSRRKCSMTKMTMNKTQTFVFTLFHFHPRPGRSAHPAIGTI